MKAKKNNHLEGIGEYDMEILTRDTLKKELFNKNQVFRELVQQHQNFEKTKLYWFQA